MVPPYKTIPSFYSVRLNDLFLTDARFYQRRLNLNLSLTLLGQRLKHRLKSNRHR